MASINDLVAMIGGKEIMIFDLREQLKRKDETIAEKDKKIAELEKHSEVKD